MTERNKESTSTFSFYLLLFFTLLIGSSPQSFLHLFIAGNDNTFVQKAHAASSPACYTVANQVSDKLKTLENSVLGFSVLYPQNWSVARFGSPGGCTLIPGLTNSPIVLGLLASSYTPNKSTIYDQLNYLTYVNYPRSANFSFINSTIINPPEVYQPSIKVMGYDRSAKTAREAMVIWIFDNSAARIYNIAYLAPRDNFTKFLPVVNEIMKSFRPANVMQSYQKTDELMLLRMFTDLPANETIKFTSTNGYIDSIGTIHIVGELVNLGYEPAKFVRVTASFYNPSDQIIGTEFTYTDPSAIMPGMSAPFDFMIPKDTFSYNVLDSAKLHVEWDDSKHGGSYS